MAGQQSFTGKLRVWVYRITVSFLRALKQDKFLSLRMVTVKPVPKEKVRKLERLQNVESWFFSETRSNSQSRNVSGEFRLSLGFTSLNRAIVSANPRSSGVFYKKFFYVEPNGGRETSEILVSDPPLSGFLYFLAPTLLAKVEYSGLVEKAIFAGSRSPHNWYHWIIDTLPAIYLSRFLPRELKQVPILIPTAALDKTDWMEMLQVANPGREIIPLSRDRYMLVNHLTWIHSPTVRLGLPPGNGRPNFAMESNAMLAYRNHLIDHFSPSFSGQGEPARIFLARDQSGLRPYNQAEILSVASEFGFSPLYLEACSLSESIEAILNAEYIIGPHGAAWGSAIFANSARGALIWTWDEADVENWFHNVLSLRGIRFQTLFTGPGDNSSPYTLSVGEFRNALSKLVSDVEQS